jgi:hypothetical protein
MSEGIKDYIVVQGSLFGQPSVVGFGNRQFSVKEINRDIANNMIVKNHYSKKFYWLHRCFLNLASSLSLKSFGSIIVFLPALVGTFVV